MKNMYRAIIYSPMIWVLKKKIEEESKSHTQTFEPQIAPQNYQDKNNSQSQIEYRPEDLNFMRSQNFYNPTYQRTQTPQVPQSAPSSSHQYNYGDFYANNYTRKPYLPRDFEYLSSLRIQKETRRKPKIRVCTNCQTTNTPSWRRSKDGRLLLCNACGLYAKLHNRARPFSKSIDGRTKALKPHFERFNCFNCRLSGHNLFVQTSNGAFICRHCGEPGQFTMPGPTSYSHDYSNNGYYQPTQQQSQYPMSDMMYQGSQNTSTQQNSYDHATPQSQINNSHSIKSHTPPQNNNNSDVNYKTPYSVFYQENEDVSQKSMYSEKSAENFFAENDEHNMYSDRNDSKNQTNLGQDSNNQFKGSYYETKQSFDSFNKQEPEDKDDL